MILSYFNWSDYGLCGLPTLSLDDYTFQALGLDDYFQQILEVIKASKGKNIRWKLTGYWGVGKSTFIYNLCYRINDNFFFKDCLENQSAGEYTHVLALYINIPRRKRELLVNIFENGLPIPWTIDEKKEIIKERRETLLKTCIRKLAFLNLRKAINEIITKDHIFGELSLSKQVDIVSKLHKFRSLPTNDFIIQTDILAEAGRIRYQDIEIFLCEYLKSKYPKNKVIYESLAAAIYPIDSSSFLENFRKLSDKSGPGLQDIDIFASLCQNADVAILLAIDEIEDWSTVVKYKLDYELLNIINSLNLSIILVFRTEVLKKIRRQSVLYRYLGIMQHLEDLNIPELKTPQILEITKGFLSTARPLNRELSLYPFTEDFLKHVSSKTKRGGKFNLRIYLRTLSEILQKSLAWKRDKPLLNDQTFLNFDVKSVIDETIIQEIRKEMESFALDVEKVRRFEVANLIAQRLLIMQNPPRTRDELEKLKAEYARNLNVNTPSDHEIIASVEDKHEREKLIMIIRNVEMH